MLRKFLRPRAVVPSPAIPSGQRVYAVGDVHGCSALLDSLLETISADDSVRGLAATTVIFLGDLVDRGPASSDVVQRVLQFARSGVDLRLLMGNHEEVFLAAIEGDEKALRLFCRIGGRETALSYGILPAEYDRMDYPEVAAALAMSVPATHRAFLASGLDMVVIGDYAFVHAGVHPKRPLDQQLGEDLRWIRGPFLDCRERLDKMIVHGHTISETVEFQRHRIGIDTGAYLTGKLSAVGLESDKAWTLETGG
ncbi:MAG TPA: metallophosphoesterase [Sphingomicrobium sp.]|jgi:serine/threonine protein phosphatase 1